MLAVAYEQVQIVCASEAPPSPSKSKSRGKVRPDPCNFFWETVCIAAEAFASGLTENKVVLTAQALPVHRRAFAGSMPL